MKLPTLAAYAACACLAVSSPVGAQEKEPVDLKVGDKAPVFMEHDDQGKIWNVEDHLGKKIIVVFFFPAAMTGGCTRQACAYRDDKQVFVESDVIVIGVSGDSVSNQQIFKKQHNLNFTLLADIKGDTAKKFGVALGTGGSVPQTIDGKELVLVRGVTAKRWTFIIDKEGRIAYKNTSVNAAEDSKEVQKAIQELKAKGS